MNPKVLPHELRHVPARDLQANPKNWRTHGPEQRRALAGTLGEVGFGPPVIARVCPDGSLMLLDGHLRVETVDPAAVVPVYVLTDIDDETADKLLATLDPLAALAGIDAERITALHATVKFQDQAVLDMLAALCAAPVVAPTAGLTDPDDVPEVFAASYVQPGDIYELGAHQIACGSCLDADLVAALMDGATADACWTDPPWNVNYGEVRTNPIKSSRGEIQNDDMGEAFPGFCAAFAATIASVLRPGGALYVAMSPGEWPVIHAALTSSGHHWSATLIWAKDSLVMSPQDYHHQYEPVWYGWREGAPHLKLEDRKQSDLWEIPRPKRSVEHPTMKPVELVVRAVNNSTRAGALVFEPFSGSGTTIIACEQTGRVCRALEIEPKYVQVAVERWEKFTGRKARKL